LVGCFGVVYPVRSFVGKDAGQSVRLKVPREVVMLLVSAAVAVAFAGLYYLVNR